MEDVARKLILTRVAADHEVVVPHPELRVEHVENTVDHALRNRVFAQDRKLIARLAVQRLLQQVAVRRHETHLRGGVVAVQEQPGFFRHAVEHYRTVGSDDDLQFTAQRKALQLQHGLLLGKGMEANLHLVDEHQRSVQT